MAVPAPVFDHTTAYVVDLDKSTAFYKNIMQLEQIDEPFKDGKHNWFRTGKHSQLHIVSGAEKIIPHDRNIHLAFRVPSLEEFMKHLDELKIKYGSWDGQQGVAQSRPDGIMQIYLQDPDGYWIEVNNDSI